MQLGSIELQIFVALILVLGSAFVALVCDFLKGNNEQLRERNIELRVRQDERERLGLFEPLAHPITWLQGLAALARNPALADKVTGQPAPSPASQPAAQAPAAAAAPVVSTPAAAATVAEPTVEPASAVPGVADLAGGGADRNPQRRHRYDEFKASAKGQTWATKEELEQLAGRAARIRARHEASQKKQEEAIGLAKAPAMQEAPAMPAPTLAPELKPELLKPVRSTQPAAETVANMAEARTLPAPIAFPTRAEPVAEPALTASELMDGLPPSPSPSPVTAPPPPPAPVLAEPPMVEKPAPAPWTFKPVAEERPRAVEIPAAAAATSMGILKPEAPALVADMVAAPAAEAEAPAVDLAETPVAVPVLEEEEFGEAPLSIFEQPLAQVPAVAAAEPLVAEVRTRIHQIDVPALAEATTEDLTPPGVDAPAEAPVAAVAAEPAVPEIPLWRTPLEEPKPAAASAEPEVSIWLTPPAVEQAAAPSVPAEIPLWQPRFEAPAPPAAAAEPVVAASEPAIPLWRTPPVEEPAATLAAAPALSKAEPEIPLWREPVGPPSGIAIDLEPEELHIPVSRTAPAPPVEAVAPPPAYTPAVEARPVDTDMPGLDVAALQKATGSSRPALPSVPAAAEAASAEGKLDLPPGLHESAVLSQLLENQTPFSGVVVAIGLNDFETLREKLAAGNDSVASLSRMVLSMLRAQDFACRFQEDEYILIYPGERGSSAQRRLFQVSEKLWDFQLRSLGNLSVMFSWGGLEVTNETLAEAVASARERMYQTKRNRKPAGLDFAVGRKKVVNG